MMIIKFSHGHRTVRMRPLRQDTCLEFVAWPSTTTLYQRICGQDLLYVIVRLPLCFMCLFLELRDDYDATIYGCRRLLTQTDSISCLACVSSDWYILARWTLDRSQILFSYQGIKKVIFADLHKLIVRVRSYKYDTCQKSWMEIFLL